MIGRSKTLSAQAGLAASAATTVTTPILIACPPL
jgi:hypothetical protein